MMQDIEKECEGKCIKSSIKTATWEKHIIDIVENKRQYANDWQNKIHITVNKKIQHAVDS